MSETLQPLNYMMSSSSDDIGLGEGAKDALLQLNMDSIDDFPTSSLGKSPRPDTDTDVINGAYTNPRTTSSSSNSSVISGTDSKGDTATMESPTKKQKKAPPRPHCVLCHIDFGVKNKTCIIQHELYEDTDVMHNKELECVMVFCSYCSYKGCSKNCDDFEEQPRACYIGHHITDKAEANEEHLEFHQDCSICYPDQVDVLDFVMGKVVFNNIKIHPSKEPKEPTKKATSTKPPNPVPANLVPANPVPVDPVPVNPVNPVPVNPQGKSN